MQFSNLFILAKKKKKKKKKKIIEQLPGVTYGFTGKHY